ncbi:MAG: hypothetical protein K8H86_07630 [Ignavibacteriaceae bacterium]|nr:hypothetical protein [Ignavibacteriaceae bacterium]
MKNKQNSFLKIFSSLLFLMMLSFAFLSNETLAQDKEDFKVLEYKTEIDAGKDKEVKLLFEDELRKIAQLTLRNGMKLASHSVAEPITIQCIAGSGELIVGEGEDSKSVELNPGTFITIEANVPHDVIAKPSISILLIKFMNKNE